MGLWLALKMQKPPNNLIVEKVKYMEIQSLVLISTSHFGQGWGKEASKNHVQMFMHSAVQILV